MAAVSTASWQLSVLHHGSCQYCSITAVSTALWKLSVHHDSCQYYTVTAVSALTRQLTYQYPPLLIEILSQWSRLTAPDHLDWQSNTMPWYWTVNYWIVRCYSVRTLVVLQFSTMSMTCQLSLLHSTMTSLVLLDQPFAIPTSNQASMMLVVTITSCRYRTLSVLHHVSYWYLALLLYSTLSPWHQ